MGEDVERWAGRRGGRYWTGNGGAGGLPPRPLKVVGAEVAPPKRKPAPATKKQRRSVGVARGVRQLVGLALEVVGTIGPAFEAGAEVAVNATDPDDWRRAAGEVLDGRLSLWRVDGER